MAGPYVINITNGTGSKNIVNGTYDVTADVTGYSNASVLPATQVISAGTNTYDFTIAATGTLTLHVSEDGTSGGTAVVGATFARCDSLGTIYGDEVTSDSLGNAVFEYMPFAAEDAPLIYYKQTATSGAHDFDPSVVSTTMTSSTKTIEVLNEPAELRTINLTDANYANLPIGAGTLTLEQ